MVPRQARALGGLRESVGEVMVVSLLERASVSETGTLWQVMGPESALEQSLCLPNEVYPKCSVALLKMQSYRALAVAKESNHAMS